MRREMRMWGVDESFNAAFWKSNLNYVRNVLLGMTEPQPADMPVFLPNDPVEALLKVIKEERSALVKQNRFFKIGDTLDDDYPRRNYHWWPLRYVNATKSYELMYSLECLFIVRSEIDPFERFYQSDPIDSMALVHVKHIDAGYILNGERDFTNVVTNAIVSYNACHQAKCVNCYARSIRWNGYSDSTLSRDWKRLVCESCGSVYNIAWFAFEKTMRESFSTKYTMRGDLFSCYHAVQTELRRKKNAKQYVAILVKETTEKTRKRILSCSRCAG
jgi:hypothetical protein